MTTLNINKMEEVILNNWAEVARYLPDGYNNTYNRATAFVEQGIVNDLVVSTYNIAMMYRDGAIKINPPIAEYKPVKLVSTYRANMKKLSGKF